jgi:hypothetical protein
MKIQKVKITAIKSNSNNPRLIKDDKFHKLVKSIKEFPQMLELRPIVVNDEMVILGGNMRHKACIEAGLKEVTIVKASELTEEQQKEFIIKDNVGFGEWDFDMLANEWDTKKLDEWGLNIPNYSTGSEFNNMNENDLDLNEEFDPVGLSSGLQRVVFIFDGKDEAESYLKNLNVKFEKRNMAWQVNLSSLYTS